MWTCEISCGTLPHLRVGNIAEGFGRRTHRDIANFLNVSLTSINEVRDELGEAIDNGHLTADEVSRALNLCKRAYVATSRFRKSVKNRPDPAWNRWSPGRASRRNKRLADRTCRTQRTY